MTILIKNSERLADRELVLRIEKECSSAETEMVETYQEHLIRFLLMRTSDRELAHDVAQETWIVVITKLRKGLLRDPRKLRSFIFSVATNQQIMAHRKISKVKNSELKDVESIESNFADPEEEMIQTQLRSKIINNFQKMTQPRDRDVLYRHYLSRDSKQDICKFHAMCSPHFDRVLYRARNRFMKSWEGTQEVQMQ